MTACTHFVGSRGRLRYLLFALVSLLPAAPTRAADEVPPLRQGLWEFERTAGAQRFAATECVDPSEDLRREQRAQDKMGCKLSPAQREGERYTYAADCSLKLKSGLVVFSRVLVLTAATDSAYRMETRTTIRGETKMETIIARRVADCSR